jgi:hypothetical protein
MSYKQFSLGELNAATEWLEAHPDLAGMIGIQISGTFSATVTLYGRLKKSGDGTAVVALDMADRTTYTQTITAPGNYQFDASGGFQLRVKVTTYVSGTVVVDQQPVVG